MRAGDRRLVLVVVLRLHLGRLLLLLVVVFTLIIVVSHLRWWLLTVQGASPEYN